MADVKAIYGSDELILVFMVSGSWRLFIVVITDLPEMLNTMRFRLLGVQVNIRILLFMY